MGDESIWARTNAVIRATGGEFATSIWFLGFVGSRPRRPFSPSVLTTSFTMPTYMHFWKRQNWHRLRRRLSTGQFLSARQTYLALFCTVRLKNPLQPSQVLNKKKIMRYFKSDVMWTLKGLIYSLKRYFEKPFYLNLLYNRDVPP